VTVSRLIAYAPFGASLGPLPEAQDYAAGFVFNDIGALTITYPVDGARNSLLGSPMEVAVEVSHDNGVTWSEPPDARFLYLRDGRDRVKRGTAWGIECAGYPFLLQKALVPPTPVSSDGQRTFTNATDGTILKTLLDEAKARGWGSGFAYDFTATLDSNGNAWTAAAQTIGYEPGKSIWAILQEMVDLGRVTWRMEGRTLRVFGGASLQNTNPMNQVKTANLVFGRDLTEAPFRRTWEGLADTVYVVGDNGKTRTRTNATAVKPWGRWESYASAAGVDDNPTLDMIGDGLLAQTADQRAEYTYGVVFGASPYRPFRDYQVGNWVNIRVDGTVAPQSMRVRQVTLTRSADGTFGGNLVVNDRFVEADILAARQIAALTGGASGGTGGTPTPPGADILAPAQVTGLSIASNTGYLDGTLPRSAISLDWGDTTLNADGTAMSDLSKYETWFRTTPTGDYQFGTTSTVSASSMSGFTPGQYVEFRVRAIDTSGNEGAWSASVNTFAAGDTTIPPAPSAPTVTTRMATFKVTWDGLANGGGAMPADLNTVQVMRRTSSGGANTLVGFINASGDAVVDPAPAYDTDYWYVLVALDRSGNPSVASPQVGPVRLARTTNSDITVGAIRAEHLTADLVLSTRLIAGAAAGNRMEMNGTGLYAYGTGVGGAGTKNTVRIDAPTGNATFLGELGTALPGETGIFMFSTAFSYAGAQVTRPVIQFNVGATRDQPSIQASTLSQSGLTLYSGANSSERETTLFIDATQFQVWMESAADSGVVGTFLNLGLGSFRVDIQGATNDSYAEVYASQDTIRLRSNNQITGSQAAVVDNTDTSWFGGYRDMSPGSTAIQGFQVLRGSGTKILSTGPLDVVNATNTGWRPINASAFNISSDRRMKRNITAPARDALDALRALPVYEFDYEAQDDLLGRRVGIMAQDALKAWPDLVVDMPHLEPVEGKVEPRKTGSHYALDLGNLLGVLVQAVQDLDVELDAAPWRKVKPKRKARTL
jgi:hypothetical protein